MDSRDVVAIEQVFQLIDREVWIITAADDLHRGGLVATWVSTASIDSDRPALLIALAPNHNTAELIDRSGCFAAHLISEDQVDLAWNFAIGSGRDRDKLAELDYGAEATGAPVLSRCRAWLDCRLFSRVEAGDRTYYWADVEAAGQAGSGPPLRERRLFELASPEQWRQMAAGRLRDIELHRPLHEAWREDLPEWAQPPKF